MTARSLCPTNLRIRTAESRHGSRGSGFWRAGRQYSRLPIYTDVTPPAGHERSTPRRGRFLRVGDSTLHVIDTEAPQTQAEPRNASRPVVLLHGTFGSTYDFTLAPLWEELTATRRVIAFDRAGLNYSRRPEGVQMTPGDHAAVLAPLLKQLRVERPILVSHSSGGAVAAAFALDHAREAVHDCSLLLMAPVVYHEEDAGPAMLPLGSLRVLDEPRLGPMLSRTAVPVSGAVATPIMARRAFHPQAVPPAFERYASLVPRLPESVRNEVRDLLAFGTFMRAIEHRMPRLHQRVEILAGVKDQLSSLPDQAARLAKELPDANLAIIDHGGHMLHVTHPKAVMAAIHRLDAATAEREGAAA